MIILLLIIVINIRSILLTIIYWYNNIKTKSTVVKVVLASTEQHLMLQSIDVKYQRNSGNVLIIQDHIQEYTAMYSDEHCEQLFMQVRHATEQPRLPSLPLTNVAS